MYGKRSKKLNTSFKIEYFNIWIKIYTKRAMCNNKQIKDVFAINL